MLFRYATLAVLVAAEVEQLLSLGATPKQGAERHVRAAMNAALQPTVNGLLPVGLVALPGMMSGQIFSRTAPDPAVAGVASALDARFARALSFTEREQLRTFPIPGCGNLVLR